MSAATDLVHLPPPPTRFSEPTSLFLDFDGTLAEIAAEPDGVIVGEIPALLDDLVRRHQGRVAVISGRSISQLDALLGPVATRIALSGSHGSEHRWDGVSSQPIRAPWLDIAALRFRAIAAQHPGAVVEEKSFGVALHYRLAPTLAPQARTLARRIAASLDLALQEGKMMIEIRMADGDKGMALTEMMRRPAMRGTRPVVVGDDVTDEAGFKAARTLEGMAVLVGSPRASHATHALPDPAAVRAWLSAIAVMAEYAA